MKDHLTALLTGCLLDLALGDPQDVPHPVRAIGGLIAHGEKVLRGYFSPSPQGERAAGAVLAMAVPLVSSGTAWGTLALANGIHPCLGWILEGVLSYQCLAARSLRDESMKVYRALFSETLDEARKTVSMIVGRDTDHLDRVGVTRAAVETVAENTSDGVIAPLLYLALGGPVLGIAYKAVNTMDSMVGYQNERYRDFGFYAAKLDDILNWIPARLSGILLCMAAPLAGLDGKNAWRVFRRDRLCHKSPNSAHTEAAAAGALRVQLAGNSFYSGELVEKPTIGDPLREVEPEDIVRANRLMFAGSALAVGLVSVLSFAAGGQQERTR